MQTSKAQLERSLVRLQQLCPDANLDLEWAYGQPKLVRNNQSIDVSPRGTKTQVDQYIRMIIVGIEFGARFNNPDFQHPYLADHVAAEQADQVRKTSAATIAKQ